MVRAYGRGPRVGLTLLFALLGGIPTNSRSVEVCAERLSLPIGNAGLEIPYCSNTDLNRSPVAAHRAVVVVHGSERNAVEYFDWLVEAATAIGAETETILVAPQFLAIDELDSLALSPQVLYWTSNGWKQGDDSESTIAHPRPELVSSFRVLEELILQLARIAPNLESIVVVGHSAGGQFVQRFAAGNGVEAILGSVSVRYVVANPSSYLYFSDERAVPGSRDRFGVPSGLECQTWYNHYKYGTENLNRYMEAVGPTELANRFRRRTVTYLLGEDDDDPWSSSLDRTCAASLQGRHRLERGVIFYHHLADRFGVQIQTSHAAALVPGVGHSGRGMLQSDCGLAHVFGQEQLASECGDPEAALPTAVDPSPNRRSLEFEGAHPNPFNPRTTLDFRASGDQPINVSVFTTSGRRVLSVRVKPDSAGRASFVWDGTDAAGARLASGVYRVDARQGPASARGSIVLLK